MKHCNSCNKTKELSEFCKDKKTSSGVKYRCKECDRLSYLKNRDKVLAYQKLYQLDNKDNVKIRNKEYRLKNKDKIKKDRELNKERNKQVKKNWDLLNKDKNKKYREDNKEKIRLNTKNWYKKNKELKQQREKDRYNNDYLFRLKHQIRRNIKQSLKKNGYSKGAKSEYILGCDWDFLSKWLSFEKHDKNSHIDHVVPISLAINEKEIVSLNHYSNLQILSAEENLLKGNRYVKIEDYMRVTHNHPQPDLIIKIVNRSVIDII
jgi:hypothetical protein